jgi:hypothetical protein
MRSTKYNANDEMHMLMSEGQGMNPPDSSGPLDAPPEQGSTCEGVGVSVYVTSYGWRLKLHQVWPVSRLEGEAAAQVPLHVSV